MEGLGPNREDVPRASSDGLVNLELKGLLKWQNLLLKLEVRFFSLNFVLYELAKRSSVGHLGRQAIQTLRNVA